MMNRKVKKAGVTLGVALALGAMATGCGKKEAKEVKVESSVESTSSYEVNNETTTESLEDESDSTFESEATVDLSSYKEMEYTDDGTVWRYGEILDVREDWVYLVATHEGELEVRLTVNDGLEGEDEADGIDLGLAETLGIGSCIKFRTPERVTNDLIETVYEIEIVEATDIFGVINPSDDSWREDEEKIALCMPETVMEGEEVQHYGYVAFIEDNKLGVITNTGVKLIEASGFSVNDLIQFKSDGIEMRNIPADIPNTWDVELMDGEVYEATKAKLDESLGQAESSLEAVDEDIEIEASEANSEEVEQAKNEQDNSEQDIEEQEIDNTAPKLTPDVEVDDVSVESEVEE